MRCASAPTHDAARGAEADEGNATRRPRDGLRSRQSRTDTGRTQTANGGTDGREDRQQMAVHVGPR